MRWLLLFTGLALALAPPAQAQENDNELEATLGEVGEAYARAYTQPLADVLGADFNAGLFHTARVRRLGLNVYLGISGAAVRIPASSRRFSLIYTGRIDVEVEEGPVRRTLTLPATFEAREVPTIFGEEEEPLVDYLSRYDTTVTYLGITLPVAGEEAGQVETIGGLANIDLIGAPMLHLRVGSVLSTDLIVRWIPAGLVDQGIQAAGGNPDEVGSAELFGLGVRHGLNTYLPVLPMDLAVQVLWQRARLADAAEEEILRVDAFAASLQASKQWRFVSLYGGVQTEETKLRVQYTFEDRGATVPVDFTLTGAMKTRLVLGTALHLGPVLLNAGATFGSFTTYTGGLGLAW
ncbi:hypothetical protein AWN76_001375 [Rhodothermaceae bacterium RA]|nr:hypothetical protein AWN76_001375 [Rhodothermaceae bacterium RA]